MMSLMRRFAILPFIQKVCEDYSLIYYPVHLNMLVCISGINVLSVTYDPVERTVYAAFEDGTGESWVPAACMPYVKIDMKQWF